MLYCPRASEARPTQQPGVAHPGPVTLPVCLSVPSRCVQLQHLMQCFLFPALALYTIYICTICAHAVLNLATNDSLINCHTVMRFKLSCLYSTVRRLSPCCGPRCYSLPDCLFPASPIIVWVVAWLPTSDSWRLMPVAQWPTIERNQTAPK